MRCPKCYYLSFEPEPRCRNCGFDLTFEPGDLYVRSDDVREPLPELDLQLRDPESLLETPFSELEPVRDPAEAAAESDVAPTGHADDAAIVVPPKPAAPPTTELPLFVQGRGDEEPLGLGGEQPRVGPRETHRNARAGSGPRGSGESGAPATANERSGASGAPRASELGGVQGAPPSQQERVGGSAGAEPPRHRTIGASDDRHIERPPAETANERGERTRANAGAPAARTLRGGWLKRGSRGPASERVGGAAGAEPPGLIDDAPLVTLPRAPRPPLAVRRPTPAPGRVRDRYQQPRPAARHADPVERDLFESVEPEPAASRSGAADGEARAAVAGQDQPADAIRRLGAACVDGAFIGTINFVVLWLTLQRLGLTLADTDLVPVLPMAALLFLLDGVYLLMFTATNGQTIGKMAAGIRVVGASTEEHGDDRVTLKQAILRAILTFPSVLALGLGFVPALVGDGRAVHDRFARTRVVRA